MRWLMNSSLSIRPCPVVSSVLYTSMWVSLARRRILHTPSSSILVRSPIQFQSARFLLYPDSILHPSKRISPLFLRRNHTPNFERGKNLHSRKALVKLMHTLPSHCLPLRATVVGIEATSISSSFCRMPSRDRNPTMILGTPRRKDWIQNLSSFRSKFCWSLSLRISMEVLSSTQLTGSPALGGLESHTVLLGTTSC